jgi:GMP synthase (glutamine-hydrolysing)
MAERPRTHPRIKKTRKERKKERRKPVLIVQHAPHEHPAAIRRALESQSIQTLWLHPYRGEHYPLVEEITGMISLGGPMGANDEAKHPWLTAEGELMRACVDAGLPVVGICLGGQLLAKTMGGRVETHSTQEVGWFPIELNEKGLTDPVLGAAGASPTVYHWHGDTFHLPPGAELLASSAACPRQAYRLGERVYGFQFHPEADHQLVLEWLALRGVDEELLEVQKQFGKATVQDATTQRNHALKGEKGSLKITAGIGSLFRRREYVPVARTMRENLAVFSAQRATVIIQFLSAGRSPVYLKGRITTVLAMPSGEYLIFQEENTVLWPIRIDCLRSIALA